MAYWFCIVDGCNRKLKPKFWNNKLNTTPTWKFIWILIAYHCSMTWVPTLMELLFGKQDMKLNFRATQSNHFLQIYYFVFFHRRNRFFPKFATFNILGMYSSNIFIFCFLTIILYISNFCLHTKTILIFYWISIICVTFLYYLVNVG